MTNGVDAEGRVEDEEDTSHPGEQKAAQSAHPPSVEVPHHKREPQTGEDDQSVIPVLPHNDRVFAQFGFVDLIPMRRFLENPSAMAVPETFGRVVGVLLLVAPCMVPDVIRAPSQRRVLERPPTDDEQTSLHPGRAVKTSVGDQTMIADRDPETAGHVQHSEHHPVQQAESVEVAEHRHAD